MAALPQRLTVVKLGGSYALSPRLPAILASIRASHAPVVVVPGGGPFADAVREAQPRMGFNDKAAHRMALLAMAQFAQALASLGDGLRVAPDLAAIGGALEDGAVAIWSPWPMADGLEALPESWDLTSDSLAAWLAGQLGASRLLLLKHLDPPSGRISLAEAASFGIVDPLFPQYASHFEDMGSHSRGGPSVNWIGPGDLDALADILDDKTRPPHSDAAGDLLPA